MAAPTSTNEVTARRLASVITNLWTKIKNTFLSKDSPAGQIFEFPSGSTDYSLEDLNQLASEGKTIRCVLPNGIRLTLYYIGPGPGDIDVARFVGPCIPDSSGGSAYAATMNGNKEWSGGTTHSQYAWSDLIGNQPAPIAHNHSASDIASGTLPDDRIASASTWNGKMNASGSNATASGLGNIIKKAQYYTASDFPTNLGDPQIGVLFRDASGDVNSSGRINLENFESILKSDIKEWPSAQELYKSDRGNVWFMSCSTTQVYRLTMPANKDCGLASLFVHTTATNGWPLIFQVGWRWNGNSFSAVPHLAYIYTTAQNSNDKMVTVKYSGGYLYICINQTQTQRRALFSLISDNIDDIGFDIISQTSSAYTNATSVTAGNTEGCVMKENIGSAIGSVSQPVYVNEAGFIKPCTSSVGDYNRPVYVQNGVPIPCSFYFS